MRTPLSLAKSSFFLLYIKEKSLSNKKFSLDARGSLCYTGYNFSRKENVHDGII